MQHFLDGKNKKSSVSESSSLPLTHFKYVDLKLASRSGLGSILNPDPPLTLRWLRKVTGSVWMAKSDLKVGNE